MSERRTPDVLPGYEPLGAAVRTDDERWPTASPDGRRRLDGLRCHPSAPVWTHECGDLLTPEDHAALDAWTDGLATDPPAGDDGPPPAVLERLDRLLAVVPFYRRLGVDRWEQLPTISRADLARAVADFVPVDADLSRVVQGTSSGSTGSALVIPWHPLDIARDLPLLEHLLSRCGITWPRDPSRLGLLNVVHQEQAFTYASTMTWRDEQLMSRVNLHPSAWTDLDHRAAFLSEVNPQVVSGSALTLMDYVDLGLPVTPLAFVSGAVDLSPAARSYVESRSGTTVLDLYGLRETGPVAAAYGSREGHHLLPRTIHVEVVDDAGRSLADGSAGEIVVTSLENPYLPLLRYRTGDRGALTGAGRDRRIVGLEGRAAVRFVTGDGRTVQSVELTQRLQQHGVRAWAVRQRADGSVLARCLGGNHPALREAFDRLLQQPVEVEPVSGPVALGPGKPRRFASELGQ
ncbi:phenylacetate--CoA ligase family protein [Luteipulveratus flavus]|uniref:CoF synthetase n=1 Tax=Luteipulveratus flavus TaxID=3031728 RepID=A0ABT6C8N7_9MICO|nr:hypothetical protein [Luteipulveratus sp. YIM 133296]MDF8264677.1 hypothetical protein [Luteipulveratus sp. YIM 133296]